MSGIVEPPILVSSAINRYTYTINTLIPHTSVLYYIYCYSGDNLVKTLQGILEGEQYKEWTTDDWLDVFIKSKVEEIPLTEVIEPAPDVPTVPIVEVIEPVPVPIVEV